MDPAGSRQVVKWTADKFETVAFILYEQVRSTLEPLFWNLCGALALFRKFISYHIVYLTCLKILISDKDKPVSLIQMKINTILLVA